MNPYLYATIVLGLFAASAFTEPPPPQVPAEELAIEGKITPDTLDQREVMVSLNRPEVDSIN